MHQPEVEIIKIIYKEVKKMHIHKEHPIPPHEREFHHEFTHKDIMEKLEKIEAMLSRIEERQ